MRTQTLQEGLSHTQETGPLRRGQWLLRGQRSAGKSKQSPAGGHRPLAVLQIMIGDVDLATVDTAFPSFLHKVT